MPDETKTLEAIESIDKKFSAFERHIVDELSSIKMIYVRFDEKNKHQEQHNSETSSRLHRIEEAQLQMIKLFNQLPELKRRIDELEADSKELNTFKDRTAPIFSIVSALIYLGIAAFLGLDNA